MVATSPRPGGAVISVRLTVLLPVLSTIEPETRGTPSTSAPATAARRRRLAARRRAARGKGLFNMGDGGGGDGDTGVSTEWGMNEEGCSCSIFLNPIT